MATLEIFDSSSERDWDLMGSSSGNASSNPDFDVGVFPSVGSVVGFGGDVTSSNIGILEENI